MKTVIQSNVMVHARVVGKTEDMQLAIETLAKQNWTVSRSGPLPLAHMQVDSTRYELVAARVLLPGDNVDNLVQRLEELLP